VVTAQLEINMLFRKLSQEGKDYVLQLNEGAKPFLEKLKENNSRFEKRLQEVLSKLKDEGKTK
jgi:hypothetical protein